MKRNAIGWFLKQNKEKKAYIYKYVSVFWKAVFVDDLFVGENSNLESVMAAKNFRGELF